MFKQSINGKTNKALLGRRNISVALMGLLTVSLPFANCLSESEQSDVF
ncbi:hypothetical protein N482_20385 [Pseudoalteromonas luteoviolacea NCIMB 1942]|uniref:Uncharacterized protein n=1 Tax=Pseudoalteromonas luteoviolacea NCIMB 1942 TaxID=1365253 RepID=A0A166Y0I1_9GAMM|nr:hypothetical protein N482_20385 [Pseudoalteromonas luteoviolacea NCIMB 1942]